MAEAARREAFLDRTDWHGGALAALAGDASSRRYFRVSCPGRTPAILMDAGPEGAGMVATFAAITGRLAGAGYSVPEVHAAAMDQGLLLLEDLGDALFARLIAGDPAQEEGLTGAAMDFLADLQSRPALAEGLPPYDAAVYGEEAGRLILWYLPAATGRPVPDAVAEAFAALVQDGVARLSPMGPCMILRDFHAENLIWLPDRNGHARVGLLDYQDALAGHPAYDPVSLLQDARRDVARDVEEAALARFLEVTGHEAAAFRADYAFLGAQRNLKILGLFARLAIRDGKPGYLPLLPRVWEYLMRDLAHPALAPLANWVAAHVPAPGPDVLARIGAAR